MPIRYRGTFLEVVDSDSDADSSHREVLSDPGSICSKEAHSSDNSKLFHREKTYVANLSENIKQAKRQLSLSSQCTSSAAEDMAGQNSEGAYQSQDFDVTSGDDGIPADPNQRDKPRRVTSRGGAPLRQQSRSGSGSGASYKAPDRFTETKMQTLGGKKQQVMANLRQKASEAKDLQAWQRLSTALSSIQEIPEQVEQAMQQNANIVMDRIQDEVAVMKHMIDSDREQSGTEKAKRSVAAIPELVMDSFSANIAMAMTSVRFAVDDVVGQVEAMSGLEATAETASVVRQIQDIPLQVRQIAADAVEKAVEDSQEQVALQLGQVRWQVPALGAMLDAQKDVQNRALTRTEEIFAGVPRALPQSAEIALEANVEYAIDTVQRKEKGIGPANSTAMPNRVVADALLRAKAGDVLTGESAETLRICNPGSIGHPELCSRPCLFFSTGQCSNGAQCLFCHQPHPRRAAHLDKRNRSLLQKLDLSDRFTLIAPILRTKLECVEFRSDLIDQLDQIRELLPGPNTSSNQLRSRQARDTRSLSVALQCMTARSLLALLSHTPICKDSVKHLAIEDFLGKVSQNLRPDDDTSCAGIDHDSRFSDSENVGTDRCPSCPEADGLGYYSQPPGQSQGQGYTTSAHSQPLGQFQGPGYTTSAYSQPPGQFQGLGYTTLAHTQPPGQYRGSSNSKHFITAN